jgi:hypothetical protein
MSGTQSIVVSMLQARPKCSISSTAIPRSTAYAPKHVLGGHVPFDGGFGGSLIDHSAAR